MKRIKGQTPIVNEKHFSDNHAVNGNAPATPKLGSSSTTFNPGAGSSILPNGPPKYIQPGGKRPMAKGLTNKRITQNI